MPRSTDFRAYSSAHTSAGRRFKILNARRRSFLPRRSQDGASQWMLTLLFESGGERQNLVLLAALDRNYARDTWPTLGECACLVDDQRRHLPENFKRFGILEKDTHSSAASYGHHD